MMVLSASIVIHNFVNCSYTSPIGEIISLKRKKQLLPGGHCLFGSPDPQDTAKLIDEQFDYDRERMLTKYDFDIIENSKHVNNLQTVDLKSNVVTDSCNNNDGEMDDNVLRRIRGEDGSAGEEEEEELQERALNSTGKTFNFNNGGLHKVHRNGAVFKRQSHLTDFWRLKRRTWESSSTKSKLGSESSSTWKSYFVKSRQ